jgi:hypothetical protein
MYSGLRNLRQLETQRQIVKTYYSNKKNTLQDKQ